MIVLITDTGYILEAGESPKVGKKYSLEEADTPTQRQNKAFHALVQEYWTTGAHSYPAKTFIEFRDFIKRDLGAGFESYVYATPEGIKKAKSLDEIPAEYNVEGFVLGKLKSWADYTKKERISAIDRLKSEMIQAGVNTRKFQEILEGMSKGGSWAGNE
jgi:hypothetical protein